MLTTRQFRGLIWLNLVLGSIGIFFDKLFPGRIPDLLREANDKLIRDLSLSLSPWVLLFYGLLIAACLISLVGLCRFKPWARGLSLVLTGIGAVLGLCSPLAYDYVLYSSAAQAVTMLSTMLHGAILAAAFFAPGISERFTAGADPGRLARRLSMREL